MMLSILVRDPGLRPSDLHRHALQHGHERISQ
jgi:hypothetical protein